MPPNAKTKAKAMITNPSALKNNRTAGEKGLSLFSQCRKHFCLMRHRTEAAANHNFEALLAVDDLGHVAAVVHLHEAAGFVLAARECRLELAPEVLHVGMTEHEGHQRLGVGRNVEDFGFADTCQRAAGDVANRVATGFARRNAHRGESTHQVRRVFDVDIVELEILSRCHVKNRVGIFFRKIRVHFELFRRNATIRDLDSAHTGRVPEGLGPFRGDVGKPEGLLRDTIMALAIVVTLAVNPAAKAGFGENFFVELGLLAQARLAFEVVDLFGPARVNFFVKNVFPCIGTHERGLLISQKQWAIESGSIQ